MRNPAATRLIEHDIATENYSYTVEFETLCGVDAPDLTYSTG